HALGRSRAAFLALPRLAPLGLAALPFPLVWRASASTTLAASSALALFRRLRRAPLAAAPAGRCEVAVEDLVEGRPVGVVLHQRPSQRVAQDLALDAGGENGAEGVHALAHARGHARAAQRLEEAEQLLLHAFRPAADTRDPILASTFSRSSSCLSTRLS